MEILKAIKKLFVKVDTFDSYWCPVCDTRSATFVPISMSYFSEMHKYGFVHNIFDLETINFAHHACKCCGASDRARLYSLFLRSYIPLAPHELKVLDIAPDRSLATFLKKFKNVQYRSMDLHMSDVDDKLDVTDMYLYEDNKFDFVLCSHVLEHVQEDIKAMSEIYRILKTGAKAIIMVPIITSVEKTFENPSYTDVGFRWKYFGQDDHVRMYAKHDFIERLQSVGFTVEQFGVTHFGEKNFQQSGIFPKSILYVASK